MRAANQPFAVMHTIARQSMRGEIAKQKEHEALLTDSGGGGALSLEAIRARILRLPLLGYVLEADFNSTSDQAIAGLPARYVLTGILVTNASVSLTTAAGGVYTAASKGGTPVVAASQVYTALTAPAKFLELTLEAVVGTDVLTATTLFLSLTTPQGAAALADVYVLGYLLPTS